MGKSNSKLKKKNRTQSNWILNRGSSCRRTGTSTRVNDKTQRHSLAVDPTMLITQRATESDILICKRFDQSKSLSNIKMEVAVPDCDSDAMQLRKILEWELSLDARDLRSHAWYHGAIPRARAEEIVGERDGDFLVRDCTSQPGSYVLSCREKGQNLHFVINKVVLQPDTVYESVQYRFEEDGFDTVPDLITYYVGNGKPITSASGAKIHTPKNRIFPLSFYANKYELLLQNHESRIDSYRFSGGSPPQQQRKDLARLSSKNKVQRSLSLLPCDANAISSACRAKEDERNGDGNCSFSNSLPRRGFSAKMQPFSATAATTTTTMPRNARIRDEFSSPPFDRKIYANDVEPPPPPKPSRCQPQRISMHDDHNSMPRETPRKNSFYVPSGSDSGNGSGDSVQSCNAAEGADTTPVSTMQRRPSGVVIKNPKYYCAMSSAGSLTTLKAFSYDTGINGGDGDGGGGDGDDDETLSLAMCCASVGLPSAFDLDAFHTLLLPMAENKPLDTSALQAIYMLLMDSGSRILANHLTRADLELSVMNFKHSDTIDYACKTGIELSVLPHGRQHRLDLIERTQCLKLLVAVTILACATESERAELLNKWIEVAIDTKTALGNLFGFCSIMLGLCMPQVQRLNETWHILRQKYTDSAFNFEAKLRPTLKCMNESTNPLAPNTTIPHLLPVVLLYERDSEDLSRDIFAERSHLMDACINHWESSSSDLGLSTLHSHLNAARQFYRSLPTFRRNAEIVLADSKVDDLLADLFRTEFHLKFLWGSRGATVPSADRYSKFEQVLNVMSEKCETTDCVSESDVQGSYATSV